MRNIGGSVAKGSYGRITINHSREDVLDGRDLTPIPIFALITPKDYGEVKNESLSWAFSENPPTIPIARGQSEMLMVVSLEKNRIGIPRKDLFNIPSEQGFSIAENEMAGFRPVKKSRVCLQARTYEGTLTIGAEDVLPTNRAIRLVYSASDHTLTLELGLILP